MDDDSKWIFPEAITLESVSIYAERFERCAPGAGFLFDLSATQGIHSSFIGFLIHAKHQAGKNGGSVTLVLSLAMERILVMLNILDYFRPGIVKVQDRKSA